MPNSPVTTRYWSASAYALGPRQYIKFSAISCAQNKPMKVAGRGKDDPDYLRREHSRQSAQGGARFDFAVQQQVLGKNMPVDDTTVEWSESDSPFRAGGAHHHRPWGQHLRRDVSAVRKHVL
jgi:hypothetical protein